MSAQPQHMQALERANIVRLNGARFRREVAALPAPASRRALVNALEDPHPDTEEMRLWRFLRAAHRLRHHRAARILHAAEIFKVSPDRKVGDLTTDERRRLAAELRRLADRAKRG